MWTDGRSKLGRFKVASLTVPEVGRLTPSLTISSVLQLRVPGLNVSSKKSSPYNQHHPTSLGYRRIVYIFGDDITRNLKGDFCRVNAASTMFFPIFITMAITGRYNLGSLSAQG